MKCPRLEDIAESQMEFSIKAPTSHSRFWLIVCSLSCHKSNIQTVTTTCTFSPDCYKDMSRNPSEIFPFPIKNQLDSSPFQAKGEFFKLLLICPLRQIRGEHRAVNGYFSRRLIWWLKACLAVCYS